MGTKYLRGKTWWGAWTDLDGEYHRESLRTKIEKVADVRLKQMELGVAGRVANAAAKADAVLNGKAAMPLQEALTRFLAKVEIEGTKHSYTVKARHLETNLGVATPIGSITKDQLLEYIEKRKTQRKPRKLKDGTLSKKPLKPIHPSTIYKELVVLRGALEMLGLPVTVIPELEQKYVPRTRWLTMENLADLIAIAPKKRRPWIALAGYAGCRASEVESIDETSMEGDGFLRIDGTKDATQSGGAIRKVPPAPQLLPYLPFVPVKRWSNVRRDLHLYCAKLGLRPVSPNDLRRTFASRLVQMGVPAMVVARMMGHKSTRMIDKVYGQLSPQTYLDAIAKAFGTVEARKEPPTRQDSEELARSLWVPKPSSSEKTPKKPRSPSKKPGK